MRVISFSCDGIVRAIQQGLFDWLREQDVDMICLQDLRALEYQLDPPEFHIPGYDGYFFDSGDPNSNGVAIYTRIQPKAIIRGFGFPCGLDMYGRYIQADFENVSIGSLMVPAATDKGITQEDKQVFLDQLQAHLNKITRKRRDFIFCGNFNIAHKNADVANPRSHEDEPGFLSSERDWFEQVTAGLGYMDAFRCVSRDSDEYTWWPDVSGDGKHGDGWRVDYQLVSEHLGRRIEYGAIYTGRRFGSHAPVIIDYDLEL